MLLVGPESGRRSNPFVFGYERVAKIVQPTLATIDELALNCFLELLHREIGLLGLRTSQREIKSNGISGRTVQQLTSPDRMIPAGRKLQSIKAIEFIDQECFL